MKYDEVSAVAAASVNNACGATATYVQTRAKGTMFCPKCGKWISYRSFDQGIGWCNQCAHPGYCTFCDCEVATNSTTCEPCRKRYYKRMRYLMERKSLSKDAAIHQIRNEGGKSGQQVRRERELHQGS